MVLAKPYFQAMVDENENRENTTFSSVLITRVRQSVRRGDDSASRSTRPSLQASVGAPHEVQVDTQELRHPVRPALSEIQEAAQRAAPLAAQGSTAACAFSHSKLERIFSNF